MTITGVRAEDHGAWTCALSDSLSLDTVKDSRELGVVVEGEMSLSPGAGVIILGPGDRGQLVCRVDRAWPRPDIVWSLETMEGDTRHLDTSTEVSRGKIRGNLPFDIIQVSVERVKGSHLLRLVQVVTYSAPRSPLATVTSNISCVVGAVRRMVQIQVTRRRHPLSSPHAWSSEDTLLLSVILTLLLVLVTIVTAFTVLLLRRFQKSSSPTPVFTCTMEPGPDDSSQVSLQPRSTNLSIIDLYNAPGAPDEEETKSLRTFRETHFELGLSPPPAYSDSISANQRPVSQLWTNQRPGHTVFHCQHSCFTRPHLDCS